MNFIVKFFATGFFVGYLPGAPGTYASLAVAIAWRLLPEKSFLIIFLILFAISFFVCGRAETLFGKKDDGRIVIDEYVGMFTAVAFLPRNFYVLAAGFILFRFFDIKKPFFIKSVQKLDGSAGVILDDILAGLASNLLIRLFMFAAAKI